MNEDTTLFADLTLLYLAREKEVAAQPTATPAHGPGGLFSAPGLGGAGKKKKKKAKLKGDAPGHPFRGNQYGAGQGGGSGDSGGSNEGGVSATRSEFDSHPPIVKRAITEGVIDIGQLSKEDKKLLDKHVKKGYLRKVSDYSFPKEKPRYIPTVDYLKKLQAMA